MKIKNTKKIVVLLTLSILFVSIVYFCVVTLNSDNFAISYFYMPFFVYPILCLLSISLVLYGIHLFNKQKVLKGFSIIFLILAIIYGIGIYSFAFNSTEKKENKQKMEFIEEVFNASNLIYPTKDFVENDVLSTPSEGVAYYALGDILVYDTVNRYTASDNTSAYVSVYYFENYPTIISNKLSDNMKERYFFNKSVTGFYVHSSDIIKGNIDDFDFSYLCQTNEGRASSDRKYESYFSTIIEKDDVLVAISMTVWHNDELEPQVMVENLVENFANKKTGQKTGDG